MHLTVLKYLIFKLSFTSYLQWISNFHASSIIESGIPGFPALQTNKLPASSTEGMNMSVLTVTFPSGDTRSVTMFCNCVKTKIYNTLHFLIGTSINDVIYGGLKIDITTFVDASTVTEYVFLKRFKKKLYFLSTKYICLYAKTHVTTQL